MSTQEIVDNVRYSHIDDLEDNQEPTVIEPNTH